MTGSPAPASPAVAQPEPWIPVPFEPAAPRVTGVDGWASPPARPDAGFAAPAPPSEAPAAAP
ncbi:ATPase, partial [Actinoplanes sp. NPDC024001]